MGITAIGDSVSEVDKIYQRVIEILDEETALPFHKLSLSPPRSPVHFLEVTSRNVVIRKLSVKNTTLKFGSGPVKLLITVCVHGDEVCGIHAVNELVDEGYFDTIPKGNVTIHLSLFFIIIYCLLQIK
jgi:hypothetical protein